MAVIHSKDHYQRQQINIFQICLFKGILNAKYMLILNKNSLHPDYNRLYFLPVILT